MEHICLIVIVGAILILMKHLIVSHLGFNMAKMM